MSSKKILLISQVFYPDEVAVANLFTNLCSVFVKNNLDVEVWCAQPSYTTLERQPSHNSYQGIRINYLLSTNFHKDRLTGRICNYLTYGLSALFKLLFSGRKPLVVTHTAPPFLAILISFVCRLKRQKILYVLLDVFPDGLIRLKKASPENIFIKIWQKMHFSAIRRSSKVVAIGRDMREWLLNSCPGVSGKVHYIPVWQDDELISPVPFNRNPFVEKHNLKDNFVIQYSGNMGLWNEMSIFAEAVNRKPEQVKFVFIGGGMRLKELIDVFREPDPGNVILIPFLPNREYATSVSACHAALVSFRSGVEGMAVPSKITGIMAAGIPVIAVVPRESEIAYIVTEENCGLIVEPGDTDGLLNAIYLLKSDDALRIRLGQNGRDAFEKKYTTRLVAAQYMELFNDISE